MRGAAALSGTQRVWALSGFLAAASAALFVGEATSLPPPPGDVRLPWFALALLFAASEVFVVHLQFRRDAHSFSLNEIPLILGLAFCAPLPFLGARMLGGGLALVAHRRQRGVKLAFNLAIFALEGCMGLVLYRRLLGDADPAEARGWLAAFVALLVVNLVAAVTISFVMLLNEGRLASRQLGQVLVTAVVVTASNVSLGLVAVLALRQDRFALLLLGVVAAVLFLAYRGYTSLSHGYAHLELLYRFTRAVGRSVEADAVLRAMLIEARSLLRADVAEVRLSPAVDEAERLVLVGDELVEAPAPGSTWWRTALDGTGIAVPRNSRDEGLRRSVADDGFKDGMAVPLRRDAEVIGAVVVADRVGDVSTFDGEDLKLFETLTNHASVSLENGRLVDALRTEADEREHQALHDSLTGLANRRMFSERVAATLAHPASRRLGVAVLLMDLDRFKEINDTLGHSTGDALLVEVGTRLAASVPPGSTVARLGGDEFAVVLHGVAGVEAARAAGEAVLDALESPFGVPGTSLVVSASAGMALWPDHGTDAASLLQKADVAMYVAKATQRGVEVYDPEADRSSPRRLAMVGELRRAIESRRLEVDYQPKAELATGRVCGVEALVRWRTSSLGPVSPEEFVAVAETTGLIRPLTLFVLETALHQCASWRRAGTDLGVAVNLSVRSLADPSLVADVQRLLAAAEVPAPRLTLEITESTVMGDVGRSLEVLGGLARLGVRLAIDDFGTGYSSLAYLKRMPVHEVKIDRSFVQHMAEDANDAAIVRSTVDLGHNLGLQVVAEGVEDDATWSRLAELGCDLAQGYLLSRPVPAPELDTWLAGRAAPLAAH